MQVLKRILIAVAFLLPLAMPAKSQTVTCSSDDGKRHYCNADTRGGVTMVKQRSGSPCTQGSTWGYDGRGIWVDRGCRADFVVGNGYGGGNNGATVTCSSDDGKRHYCSANTNGGVTMVRQRSGSPCTQGSTWGYDGRGIWVDRGCRADFQTGNTGYRPRPNPGYNNGGGQTITCSSDDGKRHYCSADTRGGVTMIKQRSGSACTQGSTWGYDGRGIWVDRGCRADFRTGNGYAR